jgi:glyoxylase-like metal-dependent hydrolase (beta-lactamase superfamily II)
MKNTILITTLSLFLSLTTKAQTPQSQAPQSQAVTYKVYAVRFAAMQKTLPLSYWVLKAPEKDSVRIDFMVWLIKGDNDRTILVDAGFLRGIDDQKEFEPFTYTRPDSALEKLAVKPTDITDIILSHPHWDHADGLSLFPNAHVWMQKEDYNYYVGGAWQKGGQPGGYAKRDVRMLLELNLAGRLTLVDGDNKEIIPGITVYTGSRHTFNSQFAVVNTGANKILLASDNIWVYYSLDHLIPPSEGGTWDNAGFVKSMERMKTLVSDPKYIIPGHDHQVFSRFPTITDGIVEIK